MKKLLLILLCSTAFGQMITIHGGTVEAPGYTDRVLTMKSDGRLAYVNGITAFKEKTITVNNVCSRTGTRILPADYFTEAVHDSGLAKIQRIITDGGFVDSLSIYSYVGLTAELGIQSNDVFAGHYLFGVDTVGAGYVSKLYDISGNSNDAVQTTANYRPVLGGGLTFDGSGDRFNIDWLPTITNQHSFMTIFDWNDNAVLYPTIFGGSGLGSAATQGGIALTILKSSSVIYYDIYSADDRGTASSTLIGNKNIIFGVYDGKNLGSNAHRLFFNDILKDYGNRNFTSDISFAGANFGVIGGFDQYHWFCGKINAFLFFDVALTEAQITALYNHFQE